MAGSPGTSVVFKKVKPTADQTLLRNQQTQRYRLAALRARVQALGGVHYPPSSPADAMRFNREHPLPPGDGPGLTSSPETAGEAFLAKHKINAAKQKTGGDIAGTHPPLPHAATQGSSSFPVEGSGARGTAGAPDPKAQPKGPATTATGLAGLLGMISGLIPKAGTSKLLPTSLASDAAAPDTALASQLQSQIDQVPTVKAQALANIAGWFGKVKSDQQTAAGRASSLAGAGANALSDAAQGIAASLGGSANAASGQIGAIGANDANAMKAIGASDSQLASDLAPIFDAQAADAKAQTQHQFDTGLTDLQNQLAAAQGKASADKAAALMQIIQANNASRQSNFGNLSDMLKTLASLQISGVNAATKAQSTQILNALRAAEAAKASAAASAAQTAATSGFGTMTPAQRQALANNITKGLLDPNSNKLTTDWPTALRNARNTVREAGLDPMNPQVIQTIIGPALANAGVTGQGGGFWQPIYQP